MSRFCTLCSSSRGNCALLSGGGTTLLIDAGLSPKALRAALAGWDMPPPAGVVLTHEHTDHIKGLGGILTGYKIPLYASAQTIAALVRGGALPAGVTVVELLEGVEVGGIGVRSFEIPHDAAGPVGFRFSLPDGRSAGVATDLGHVTQRVEDALAGCDLVLLESNYDPAMLRVGPYPWSLKRRVAGERGHLSNEAGAALAQKLAGKGATRFVLGHLSLNNNHPDIAYLTARNALEETGAQEGKDYLLTVAPPYDPHPLIVF